jgi:hypothetical protein
MWASCLPRVRPPTIGFNLRSVLWGPKSDVLQPETGENIFGSHRGHRVRVPVPLPHLLLHLLLHGEPPPLLSSSPRFIKRDSASSA